MKARVPKQGNSRADMMKKIQDMQEEMNKAQSEVEEGEYSATSGGGAVSVRVNGKHEVLSIEIKPEVVDPEDVEILEDMIIAAVNEAMRKAADTMEQEMGKVTGGIGGLGGLGIPGMGL